MNKLISLALILAFATAATDVAVGADCAHGDTCVTDASCLLTSDKATPPATAGDTTGYKCYIDTTKTCSFANKDNCSGTDICIEAATGIVTTANDGVCTARIAVNTSCT